MLDSLLWKEWRECRWKMLALFGVYLLLALFALAIERVEPYWEAQYALYALVFVMPGIVAMGTIADERVQRTARTLQALPVMPTHVFFCKFVAGLGTLLLPLLAIQIICRLVFPVADSHKFQLALPYWTLSEAGLTVSLYLWILLLAGRRRAEMSVGLTYIAMLMGCLVIAVLSAAMRAYATRVTGHDAQLPQWWTFLVSLTPIGFARPFPAEGDHMNLPTFAATAAVQAVTWLPLWFLARRRCSTALPERIACAPELPAAPLAFTLAGCHHPILWKSWRESRRLVLGYLAATSVLIVATSVLLRVTLGSFREGPFILLYPLTVFSLIVTAMLGVDVGMRESETQLENFWKSRPIPAPGYFWRRYIFGWLFSLLAMTAPLGLLFIILCAQSIAEPSNGVDSSRNYAGFTLMAAVPPVTLAYAVAVFMATLSRRRIIPLTVSLALCLFQCYCPVSFPLYMALFPSPLTFLVYLLLFVAPCALFTWLAKKSTAADWRAWLERKSDTPLTPARA